ncbi:hypothetical protein SUGI_0964300 [Cryptomeria japonica]|uniref:shikimate kinase 2, chloroplastic n=1 Tax=Cryptomeria japonica TaxID=3369 RepID=UPI00241498DC|nr:shikimate kinase 2, chloroplastic [Cryptomeria japonica]XP_057853582.2 shikimate kinase 2, chloroplastic [Cryptomeria japonica]XP_057853583.2 shikimate kinase 2, chloroplastic [Cryptomeria japonica]GLJ45825.1 hypothetical protein SUGI_0964300 [Cryptomeria japonica]
MELASFRTCCRTYNGKSYPLFNLKNTITRRQSDVKWNRAQALRTVTTSLRCRLPTFSFKCSQEDAVSEVNESRNEDEETLFLERNGRVIASNLKGSCLFIVGMTTSIKSAVAKKISEVLGYYFFDSEKLVEQASGESSAAWKLKEKDEEGFRDSESEVLRQLSSMTRLVVSTGDGSVVRSSNLGYMRNGITIWLDIPLEALAKEMVAERVETQGHFAQTTAGSYSQALERLSKLLEERKGGYATADVKVSLQKIVDESGYENIFSLTPTVIANEVLKGISKLLRYKELQQAASAPAIQRNIR